MIDMHMHTLYSDGTDTLEEILTKANNIGLETISITDHDTCDNYRDLEKINVSKYYQGKIVIGCEFMTSFNGQLIEILGYGFDRSIIDDFLKNFYTEEHKNQEHNILRQALRKKLEKYDFKFDESIFNSNKSASFYGIYHEIIQYPENLKKINEDIFGSFSDFFRRGLAKPSSKLFINYARFKPNIKDIIKVIHKAGGKAFLAHLFQYKVDNPEEFLKVLFKENDIDGIECYHTIFSKKQMDYLTDFAKKHNLLISGGSDYHGRNKKNHNLGTGNGNLNISKDVIANWEIDFL